MAFVQFIYNFLWGDLITISLPHFHVGLSLLVLILIPAGIFFTIRTRFLPIRHFKDMIQITMEKKDQEAHAISGLEGLIVSTATRVGMGNLVGVVAAISAGGAGAVFWMWLTAIVGSSTAFVEATLAQLYHERDPLYGGYRGGPAYYIHAFFTRKTKKKKSIIAIVFAFSGLLCWFGISQVVGNSVSSAFENAFHIPPIYTTVILVALAACIVLRKNMTVKVLDVIVPIMACFYFGLTIYVMVRNITLLPSVIHEIFVQAFGLKQMVAGGFGAVLMNGVKRGLFSNEAGSGSAPCASATSHVSHPVKSGMLQSLGVFIDTIVICTCTAMIMLTAPHAVINRLQGMDLLQSAMSYHFGQVGVIFIAIVLWLFSFSTFIGILYYARSNIAYIFGDRWMPQTIYKVLALSQLFIGGLATYTFVWDLGDIGIGLMTIFNMIVLIPMSKEAIASLKEYEEQTNKERVPSMQEVFENESV